MNLLWLIPLHIIMGAAFASCYVTLGGYTYPWLQAMATQFLSYCISVSIELRYRSIYQRLRADEVALAAAAADARVVSKLERPQSEQAISSIAQVGCLAQACCTGCVRCSAALLGKDCARESWRSACHSTQAAFRAPSSHCLIHFPTSIPA